MVLLRGVEAGGFVFYTNLNSPKCVSLAAHPAAAMTFYWEPLRRQIRIEGVARPVSPAAADAYFASRPRESRLAAWASNQSSPIESRAVLEDRFAQFEKEYADREVPRPPFWSGFAVVPDRMEFWAEREHRLHDRFLYARTESGWVITRLAP
jgi:pyridoxamine 5'-phosphate oxidase